MRVGNVSLLIPEGHEKDSGHVEIPHGTVYRIKLMNHWTNRKCDATIRIDGKEVGCFRVHNGGSITLERGSDDRGKFTFFRADSDEAQAAGVSSISADLRGLVQVVFKLEKERVNIISRGSRGGPCGQSAHRLEPSCANHFPPAQQSQSSLIDKGPGRMQLCSAGPLRTTSAGVTGLTGHSNQSFFTVAALDYDTDEEVTISLRLICGQVVRPLEAVKKGNPVPETVV